MQRKIQRRINIAIAKLQSKMFTVQISPCTKSPMLVPYPKFVSQSRWLVKWSEHKLLPDKFARVLFIIGRMLLFNLSNINMPLAKKKLVRKRYVTWRPDFWSITKGVELLVDRDLQSWHHTKNIALIQYFFRSWQFATLLAPCFANKFFNYELVCLSDWLACQVCQFMQWVWVFLAWLSYNQSQRTRNSMSFIRPECCTWPDQCGG